MALNIDKIREIIKEPAHDNGLMKSINQERRLRLHSCSYADAGVTTARNNFESWVSNILPKDKFEVFKELFKTPDTIPLVSRIVQTLAKVFEGVNPNYSYDFVNQDYLADWEQYRTNELNEPEIWKTEGLENMKTRINSVLVVDLPESQTSEAPKPYFFWLPIEDIIDYELTDSGSFSHIIFKGKKENTIYAYDYEYYRVCTVNESLDIVGEPIETPHNLEYCPAAWFWTDLISSSIPELKRSPISDFIDQLDWTLFFNIAKKYSDLYAPYPVYWGYAQDCEFETDLYRCSGGKLRSNMNDEFIPDKGGLKDCPACFDRINGVGSFVEVPAPSEQNDNANLAPPVGMVNVDINALKYNVEEVERIENEIYSAVTGNSLDSTHFSQAVNELQVMSIFEDQTQVLLNLKRNFEKAQKFVDSTICKLRYGSSFIDCHIDYGTEFYLFTANDILKLYENAKVNNLDSITLDLLQDRYYNTLFRNDSKKAARTQLILNIDPYRHLTSVQALELSNIEGRPDKYILKTNLSALLMRFERENGLIENFGVLLERFDRRIEAIQNILFTYINIENATNESRNNESAEV